MPFALEIENLDKRYASGVKALNSVSLHVDEGDFFALLGPNGAGKSTLISTICSLVLKDSGKVKIFGHDIDTHFSLAKQELGVVPQEFNFNAFEKVRDIVINQAGYYGLPRNEASDRADHYLEKLGLWEKRDQASRFLSGGMKRRLMIARALIHSPRLLVLDEPTAGVDIELRRTMWDFVEEINASGTTIILTTHYLEEAESLCRNVGIINHGEIVERSDMQSLLANLKKETFVLDLDSQVDDINVDAIYQAKILEDKRIEVSVEQGQALNPIFSALDKQGIQVLSLRNKVNRLEELFVDLVSSGGGK